MVPWLGLEPLGGLIPYLLLGLPVSVAIGFALLFRITRDHESEAARVVIVFVASVMASTASLAGAHLLRVPVEREVALERLVGTFLLVAWCVVPVVSELWRAKGAARAVASES